MLKLAPGLIIHTLDNKHQWMFIGYYENTKEKWKDLETGLVWYDTEDKTYNHDNAIIKFTGDKRLPSKEEWEQAEKNGIRQVLNFERKWYWSSSVHSGYSNFAYVFNGRDGYIDFDARVYDVYSVRCVAAR